MALPAKLKNYLDKKKLAYEPVEHKTVFTAYDLAQTLAAPLDTVVKTLLIKADKQFYLVALSAGLRLDLKKLKTHLKAKQLSIAKEKDMTTAFKVKAGALTPFGGLHGVPVVADIGLKKVTRALFGTGSFTDSVRLKVADYLKAEAAVLAKISQRSDLKLQVKLAKHRSKPKSKRKTKR